MYVYVCLLENNFSAHHGEGEGVLHRSGLSTLVADVPQHPCGGDKNLGIRSSLPGISLKPKFSTGFN